MTTNQQLELGFNGTPTRVFGGRYEARVARGRWWFARMREAVAGAIDWQKQVMPRPEQSVFPDLNRELKA
ncbi:MAG: hypothetical protein ABSE48_07895 [Verrucomicrobiota bacterium]|jgi:hypothetical protein